MSSNFNNTTPAAPAGSVNVSWQTDGSGNDSAYVTASTSSLIADAVDLLAQAANVGLTTWIAVTTPGLYRVSAYIIVTQDAAGTGSPASVLPSVVIGWTDQNNGQTQSFTLTPTNAGNTLETFQQAIMVLDASSTSAPAITYHTTGYASAGSIPMQYALHLRLEQY
jgi:hypothetical protein